MVVIDSHSLSGSASAGDEVLGAVGDDGSPSTAGINAKHHAHDWKQAPSMRRSANASTDRSGVSLVADIVERQLKWIFREQPIEDYGIDAQIEIVTSDAVVTGRLIGLQIKSGESFYNEVKRSTVGPGWYFYADSKHLDYWLRHSLPVLVVINDPETSVAHYEFIDPPRLKETPQGFSCYIPEKNRFDGSAVDQVLNFVSSWRDLESSLPDALALLPPNSASALNRAARLDRTMTARLANVLSAGRSSPGMTAATVVAAQPSWIVTSPAEQDLWIAIGNYCIAHGFDRTASDAFWLASEAVGERTTRAQVVTGLCLLQTDRLLARSFLEAAREQGEVLLADVGLAAIDVPKDDARVLPIPQSIIDASDEELDAEPTVLNFLAEMAMRSGDEPEAVRYRERALESDADPDPTMSLLLAETIWRQARQGGGPFSALQRRALALSQQAIEERRRWDGPSADALATYLDIQLTAGFNTDAVRAALPASQGGTARANEATDRRVARRGAIAALASGNTEACEFFLSHLTGGPEEQEIHALQADEAEPASAIASPAAIERWRAVLAVATEHEMQVRAISRLVALGVWPDQTDDLINRSILPKLQGEILRASWRIRSREEPERVLGLAQLRDLARESPIAAFGLVMHLAANAPVEVAIAECEQQLNRWGDPTLIQILVDLHRKGGDRVGAAEIAFTHVDEAGLPVEVRQTMCSAYVAVCFEHDAFPEAIKAAEKGLGLGPHSDLAWNLITVLATVGNLPRARIELDKHNPEPITEQETRLWLDLHLGVPLSAKDAQSMLSLAERYTSTSLGQPILQLLSREVLTNQDGEQYPTALIKRVRKMVESDLAIQDHPLDATDNELRTFLDRGPATQTEFSQLISDIRSGRASHHDAAAAMNQPYGSALLQHVSGVHVAFDLEPEVRAVGIRTALDALQARSCIVDLSALRTLSILHPDVASLLRDRLRELITTADTARDATRTRELMRGIGAAASVVAVSDTGEATRQIIAAPERLALADASARLERETAKTQTRTIQGRDLVAQIRSLATTEELPVWCDESSVRQKLRVHGVACFSTLDLLDALTGQNLPIDKAECIFLLGLNRYADLPHNGDTIARIAETEGWGVGSANVAVSRRSWWTPEFRAAPPPRSPEATGGYQSAWAMTWEEDWAAIARAAAGYSYEAVVTLTGAALIGIVLSVPTSRRTQVYQQLAVESLLACHIEQCHGAEEMLADLASDETTSELAPEPVHIMRALAAKIRLLGDEDADLVAWNLTGQPQIRGDY